MCAFSSPIRFIFANFRHRYSISTSTRRTKAKTSGGSPSRQKPVEQPKLFSFSGIPNLTSSENIIFPRDRGHLAALSGATIGNTAFTSSTRKYLSTSPPPSPSTAFATNTAFGFDLRMKTQILTEWRFQRVPATCIRGGDRPSPA